MYSGEEASIFHNFDKVINRDRIENRSHKFMKSPFRYPGGKTWMMNEIKIWLSKASSIDKVIDAKTIEDDIKELPVAQLDSTKKQLIMALAAMTKGRQAYIDPNVENGFKDLKNGLIEAAAFKDKVDNLFN